MSRGRAPFSASSKSTCAAQSPAHVLQSRRREESVQGGRVGGWDLRGRPIDFKVPPPGWVQFPVCSRSRRWRATAVNFASRPCGTPPRWARVSIGRRVGLPSPSVFKSATVGCPHRPPLNCLSERRRCLRRPAGGAFSRANREGGLCSELQWRGWCVCVCDVKNCPGGSPDLQPCLKNMGGGACVCVCGWGRVQQEVRDRKSGGLQLVCWSRSWAGPQQFVNMCMYVRVCVRACVHQGLVQVIVYGGEGAGAAASPCHDGETLGRLADSLGQRRLLGQVVSL